MDEDWSAFQNILTAAKTELWINKKLRLAIIDGLHFYEQRRAVSLARQQFATKVRAKRTTETTDWQWNSWRSPNQLHRRYGKWTNENALSWSQFLKKQSLE